MATRVLYLSAIIDRRDNGINLQPLKSVRVSP
jgi:hypothetical protein